MDTKFIYRCIEIERDIIITFNELKGHLYFPEFPDPKKYPD